MSESQIIKLIRESLKALGYTKGHCAATPLGFNRYNVLVDGLSVGIYDIDRKTFVD